MGNSKMEAIKIKMDQLVKDKVELIKVASSHEEEMKVFDERCKKFEGEVRTLEKAIAAAENDLDDTMTEYIEAQERLEEVLRKSKIVEGDLERINEKAEDFEQKIRETEETLRETSESLRKMEEQCGKNADREDELDNQSRSLVDKLKVAETNAEFGERTVEKLESTIDSIQNSLYEEKMAYRDLSVKLDNTLREMMKIAESAADHDCE